MRDCERVRECSCDCVHACVFSACCQEAASARWAVHATRCMHAHNPLLTGAYQSVHVGMGGRSSSTQCSGAGGGGRVCILLWVAHVQQGMQAPSAGGRLARRCACTLAYLRTYLHTNARVRPRTQTHTCTHTHTHTPTRAPMASIRHGWTKTWRGRLPRVLCLPGSA